MIYAWLPSWQAALTWALKQNFPTRIRRSEAAGWWTVTRRDGR